MEEDRTEVQAEDKQEADEWDHEIEQPAADAEVHDEVMDGATKEETS